MGHRHMTYIYIYDEKGNEAVGTLYNQWNFEKIQAHKIIRFEKQLAKWSENNVRFPHEYSHWIKLYESLAMISDNTTTIEYSDYSEWYDECTGMYCEHNNNGWQFLIIKVDNDYVPVKITHGFKLNKYRLNKKTGKHELEKNFVNLYKNVLHKDHSVKDEYKLHKIENYLKDFSEEDQKILEKINNSFDEKIIKFAEKRIRNHIDKIRYSKISKVC
jgi:hypothetical protein